MIGSSNSAKSVLFSFSLPLVFLWSAFAHGASSNPRELFYEELKSQDDSTGTGVAYCLELRRSGQSPVLCNNRFPFQSGDSIRLHLKTTVSSFAYIAVVGSSGKRSVVYPPQGSTEDNRLEAGKEYVVPPHGQITFDDRPGEEQLFVFLSREKLDFPALATERGMTIDRESLTGVPQQVGKYSVLSNDGFYELGKKTAGSGLVYVHNPTAEKPTVLSLALVHLSRGSSPEPKPDQPDLPSTSKIKVKIDYSCLHNDGAGYLNDESEVVQAFKRTPAKFQTGVNCGSRDQYVAGLNHLYANWVNQQIVLQEKGALYYVQQDQNLRRNDTGERIKTPDFHGETLSDPRNPGRPWMSPALAAFPKGMAYLQNSLSGGKCAHLVYGEKRASRNMPRLVKVVGTGRELDAVWDEMNGAPLIVSVDCAAKMFQPSDPGGHVVVLSERRKASDDGRSSPYEYKLLNSWGRDADGKPRNGWVTSDAIVSAMNFTDAAHDESLPPHRELKKDSLPLAGPNRFARGNDGFDWDTGSAPSWSLFKWNTRSSKLSDNGATRDRLEADGGLKDASAEAEELRSHIMDSGEGLSEEERRIARDAVSSLLANTDDDGYARRFPIGPRDCASILHSANRLFNESAKIYSQGLDLGDRNRALVGLLHDNANPEHINQGGHNTCNVLTIMKVETFLRPAVQVKRFVDMYTNSNGNATVDMPLINAMMDDD